MCTDGALQLAHALGEACAQLVDLRCILFISSASVSLGEDSCKRAWTGVHCEVGGVMRAWRESVMLGVLGSVPYSLNEIPASDGDRDRGWRKGVPSH